MSKKLKISGFVDFLEQQLNEKAGYIMGSYGQDPKKWSTSSWWYTQYSGDQRQKALYWREHAKRVFDCQGLVEGYILDVTGKNVNTKARYNYSGWCDVKGTGAVPAKYRVPGLAVFIHSASSGYITHVGYLYKPVIDGNPSGDWYVIESRGVMYGVVKTRMSARGWNRWGFMTKYFDYGNIEVETSTPSTPSAPVTPVTPTVIKLGSRLLKRGSKGEDVSALQQHLVNLGYNLGVTGTKENGVDGDYGSRTVNAVKQFQEKYGLTVDGQYGSKSHAQLLKIVGASALTFDIRVTGGTVNVRSAPNTTTGAIKYRVKKGAILKAIDVDAATGWYKLKDRNYISNKYIEKV